MRYIRLLAQFQQKKWDVKTTTTSDFTVEVTIPLKVWETWTSMHPDKKKGLHFKEYLENELVEQLKLKPKVFKKAEGGVNIAVISLGYDNGIIVKKLIERGAALQKLDFDKYEKLEKEL